MTGMAARREGGDAERSTLTRVELDEHGRAHCAWCDLPLARGEARCVRRFHHAPGAFSRNNGEKEGFNAGGWQNEYLHPSCTFEVKEQKVAGGAACIFCAEKVRGWAFVTRLGAPGARCTVSVSGHAWMHAGCVQRFIGQHRGLLAGYLGVRQQFEEDVAWHPSSRGSITAFFQPKQRVAAMGNRPLPSSDAVAMGALRGAFSGFSAEEEEQAVARHRQLQKEIKAGQASDRARARALNSSESPPSGGASAASAAAAPASGHVAREAPPASGAAPPKRQRHER